MRNNMFKNIMVCPLQHTGIWLSVLFTDSFKISPHQNAWAKYLPCKDAAEWVVTYTNTLSKTFEKIWNEVGYSNSDNGISNDISKIIVSTS